VAQHLFSEVVFNLDTRRIESYKLKPWADDFLMLRMEAYYDEFGDLEEGSEGYHAALEKADSNTLLGCWNPMPHRGLLDTSVFEQLAYAARRMILETYVGIPLPQRPVTETLISLAELFGISEQRVWQIVHGRRK